MLVSICHFFDLKKTKHEKMIFIRLKGIQHLFLWVYVGSLSTCVCEHIKFTSMEEETEDLQDDYIYPSDFDEELDYVVQVEDIIGESFENDGKTYFNLSDYDSEFEGDEEIHQKLHENDVDQSSFSCANIDKSKDELSSLFLEYIPIDTFPKYVHFTCRSMKLMIDCLQAQSTPTFEQIRQSDVSFRPLEKNHGRYINVDDVGHTIEKWKKLQESVKLVNINDEVFLSPMRQYALERKIPLIELWPFIVQKCHVNVDGKHLPLTSTLNDIRKKWSTDIRVGGIHSSYVGKCLRSCAICDHVKLWDEVYNIHQHLLDVTLDKICTKYMVFRKLRRSYKCEGQIVKYYHRHRSGSKKRPHRKIYFISLSQEKRCKSR